MIFTQPEQHISSISSWDHSDLRPYFNLSLKLLAKLFIYIMLGQIPTKPFAALQSTQVDLYPGSEQSIISCFQPLFYILQLFPSLLKKKSESFQRPPSSSKCH